MAFSGRIARVQRGTTNVTGARVDTLRINNEPQDITDKDSAGWVTLLAGVGVRSVDMTVTGLTRDSTLIAVALGTPAGLLDTWRLVAPGVGTASGAFYLSSFEVTGEHDGAIEFTATLASSGPITWA